MIASVMSNEGEARAVGGEQVLFRTTLVPGWGWLRWLEVAGRFGGAAHVALVFYGLLGMGQRAEERESFRGVVTPSRLVYTQVLHECCARQSFWLQTDLDEVTNVRRAVISRARRRLGSPRRPEPARAP